MTEPKGPKKSRDTGESATAQFASRRGKGDTAPPAPVARTVADDMLLTEDMSSRRGSRLLRAVLSPVWRLMERGRPHDY